jgi:hypothetical protein
VAPKARDRVYSSIHLMPGEVISTVYCPGVIFGLILDGRFQFGAGNMAVVTETLPVTQSADNGIPRGL